MAPGLLSYSSSAVAVLGLALHCALLVHCCAGSGAASLPGDYSGIGDEPCVQLPLHCEASLGFGWCSTCTCISPGACHQQVIRAFVLLMPRIPAHHFQALSYACTGSFMSEIWRQLSKTSLRRISNSAGDNGRQSRPVYCCAGVEEAWNGNMHMGRVEYGGLPWMGILPEVCWAKCHHAVLRVVDV